MAATTEVAISINAAKCWQIKSWDRFQLPCPGTRLTVVLRGPYHIPENLSGEDLTLWTEKIEAEFLKITCDPPAKKY